MPRLDGPFGSRIYQPTYLFYTMHWYCDGGGEGGSSYDGLAYHQGRSSNTLSCLVLWKLG